jgi:hypothetical protein
VWTLIYYSLAFWWLAIPLRRENRQITANNRLAVIDGYWELSNCRRIILQCPSVVPVDNSIIYRIVTLNTINTINHTLNSLSQVINTLTGIHQFYIFSLFYIFLHIEIDTKSIVDLLKPVNDGITNSHPYSALINDCRSLI